MANGKKAIQSAIKFLEPISAPYNGKMTQNRIFNKAALDALKGFKLDGTFERFENLHFCFARVRHSKIKAFSEVTYGTFKKFRGGHARSMSFSSISTKDVWKYYDVTTITGFSTLSDQKAVIADELTEALSFLWCYPDFYNRPARQQAKIEKLTPVLKRKTMLDQMSLYFLKIKLTDQVNQEINGFDQTSDTIHKIGITGRTIHQRLPEIKQDIKDLNVQSVEVIACLHGMAHIESWFKWKYKPYRFEYKSFEEYFILEPNIEKQFKQLAPAPVAMHLQQTH